MMTSNLHNLNQLAPPMSPVWIARGHPRCKGGWQARLPAGVTGRADMRLAPTWAMLKGHIEDYHRDFAKILAALDPAAVYRELGENAVLLCFCEQGCLCHRRIVAEWLEHALGVMVPELGERRDETHVHTTSHYPFFTPPERKLRMIEERMAADGLNPASPYWEVETGWDAAGNCLTCGEAGRCECTHEIRDAPEIKPAPRPRVTAHRQIWNAKEHCWQAAS